MRIPGCPVTYKVLLLVGVLLFTTVPLVSDEAEAAPNPIPMATVWFDSDVYHVTVRPYSLSLAVMHGNITVEKACGSRVWVNLRGESDTGWGFEIRPARLVFVNPMTQRFTVTVTIPPGAPPVDSEFSLTASVETWGLACYTVTNSCRIVTEPFYTSRIEPVGSPCVVGEDGEARLKVRMRNTGTIGDQYVLKMSPQRMPEERW